MGIKSKKSPYDGIWMFIPMMLLPSIVMTAIFYVVIARWQPQYTTELNWASAKTLGFGIGVMYHISCWLANTFTEDYLAMKSRLKEFSENIVVSASLAFKCYFEDIRTLGLAFWIDVGLIGLNFGVFLDALLDYLAIRG
ncbi:MAG: hypothetical protein E7628_02610 [Ruminococcaceae bacterium]|nr:hypothetical protein [Oscillospiraceae bacterium]